MRASTVVLRKYIWRTFRPTMVQIPNLALIETKRITVSRRATTNWATPHPTEFRHTLLSYALCRTLNELFRTLLRYATPCRATPHPLSYATPSELRRNLLSYAHHKELDRQSKHSQFFPAKSRPENLSPTEFPIISYVRSILSSLMSAESI